MPLIIKLSKAKVKVHIEEQSKSILNVQELTDCISSIAGQLLEQWVRWQQERCLDQRLGGRWKRLEMTEMDLACPTCGSMHVRRKCWRTRQLTLVGYGRLSFARRQLYCVDCQACWMPFADDLELPCGAYGRQMLSNSIDQAIEHSYQKAADSQPTGPSASTIHRTVGRLRPPEVAEEAETVVADGTQVPRWKAPGQISVSLIHEIARKDKQPASSGRAKRRKRRVLGVVGGREAELADNLSSLTIHALVHDGNLNLDDQARYVGRCRWHIPYTVRYLLYHDAIKGQDNIERVKCLKEGIERYKWDPENLEKHLERWLATNADAPTASAHVANSKRALLTMSKHAEEFTTHTTSHMEREMVEINKRFENGGGWTPRGAEKLLWLHQLKRFEPQKYQFVKQQLINQTVFPN